MKVRIRIQPSGLLNGQPWPESGDTIDLPDEIAEEMAKAGHVEAVKAAKPAKAEKRPASRKGEETR